LRAFGHGDLLEALHLLVDGRFGAMELEEQHRAFLEAEVRVLVECRHLHLVDQLGAGEAEVQLDRLNDRVDRAVEGAEGAHGGQDLLRDAIEANRQLRHDPERAFGADQQLREVVAGRRFAGAARGAHDGAVGHDGRDVEDVVAHGAVADGGGARGARCRHAADGGLLGTGINREEQAHVTEVIVQLFPRDAGLDNAVEVRLVDRDDLVHAREVDGDAAARRIQVTFERRAGAERNDRRLVARGDADDFLHFLGRDRPNDGVGRLIFQPRERMAMLATDGLAGLEALAEALAKDVDRGRAIRLRRCRSSAGHLSRAPEKFRMVRFVSRFGESCR
jgi:hypothetical protein